MKIYSLITALAIAGGSSSAALADTSVQFTANARWSYGTPSYSQPVVVRDHLTPVVDDCDQPSQIGYQSPPIWNPSNKVLRDKYGAAAVTQYDGPVFSVTGRRAYGMVPLTQPTRVENTITDREDFLILGQAGPVRALQLRGVRGSTFVTRVTVEFTSGPAQIITPNRTLDANGALNINIASASPIKRIFVYGQSGPGALYQILGI